MDAEKGTTSFDERIRRDYRWHTVQYWFVASVANGMLWAQIIIGAAITALGATHASGSKTATIYLGAASTVIAGFLTYFKSRSQPVRSRQFRQALRKVRNKMGKGSPPDFLRGHISTVSWRQITRFTHETVVDFLAGFVDEAQIAPNTFVPDETAHEISDTTTPEEAVNKAMDILKL
ncbi:hypothetical protein LTR96_002169 [Exophiala xenobiotica]|uniref:SMODS and SLOG-associating 2TM effector domain-containing protein n=1 Tax=Vermiconidia calcicola TaxID=1690605 RepID=A0AAV9Q776_9PEZI|nr:hypothetical protein LTR92_004347 [Exophiala xenobiotica]KAK5536698.1 hypothetical protein LTR25_005372 [Vermiconidia calcicola]KAK5272539.1 hypothetical protein LTR96_002169 [Exophiala xenobiotica]KAK5375235.1 hypothetical protein LTS03_005789 [Exophiala xenobiotica]KAK5404385.1 hypothetical protein LTR06_009944 [Exophiala xenobiotica]